ncbi:MAG TPA: hypothetical protein VKI18_03445 [Albitalea sp.]|nr:hypothetical protein [Albitalea sp.]
MKTLLSCARLLSTIIAVGVLTLHLPPARAFDKAGHFYTAYALARTAQSGATENERLLVALCAQLPDMAEDLDATAVYFRAIKRSPIAWIGWGTSDTIDSDRIRKMITIQQLLHALTGGDAKAIQQIALESTAAQRKAAAQAPKGSSERAHKLCAYGFSLHFLGDSVAHQQLRDPAHMYATGKGHAMDLHYPDYALCAKLAQGLRVLKHCEFDDKDKPRFDAWLNIWKAAANTYDPEGWSDVGIGPRRESLAKTVQDLGQSGNDWNDWQEEEMRRVLGVDKDVGDFRDFIDLQKSDRTCKAVLADARTKLAPIAELSELDCTRVWAYYRDAVMTAFKASDDAKDRVQDSSKARALLSKEFRDVYVDDPLDR